MAKATIEVIQALRKTVDRLQLGLHYNWTHQGACNCGHLAQVITPYSQAEIHAYAMQKAGDWSEHASEYCPESGYPIDWIIKAMIDIGFTTKDIEELERLSNPKVLKTLDVKRLPLRKNNREDLIYYLQAWIRLLEDQWSATVQIPSSILESSPLVV